ncbi:histidine kinase [Brevibacterium casei]|uniref:histidine kinase n=1 Tax=Brevibacterium TaxID=1696 RepID=UPI0021AFA25F|nr:histidine kinase [Brevibacterium casei]MCT1447815.1 histidine kinase [Brevibacterium casei]MDH5148348.1 histidine kinase [Brevibacterium casei]
MSEKTPEHPQEPEPTGSMPAEAQHPHGDSAPQATEAGQFRTTPLDLEVPFTTPRPGWTHPAEAADGFEGSAESPTREYPHTQAYDPSRFPAAGNPSPAAGNPSPAAGNPSPAASDPTQAYGTPAQTYIGAAQHPAGAQPPMPPRVEHALPGAEHPGQYASASYGPGGPVSGPGRPAPSRPSPQRVDAPGAQYPTQSGPQPGPHAGPFPGQSPHQEQNPFPGQSPYPGQVRLQPPRPPRRKKPRPNDLVMVPVTGPMPLSRTDVTDIPPEGPIDWPKRPVGVVGVANLFLSAVMAILWAWIPVGLLITGIGGIFALGLGVLALILWVLVQQVANVFERYRAELVYDDRIPVPTVPRSTRESGFARFLHNRWLLVSSGSFWRSTAHHYVKMLLGLAVVGGTITGICGGILGVFSAINPDGIPGLFFGGGESGLGRVGVAIGSLIILASSLAILWFAPYLDRALDRSLLPPARTAALQAEVSELDRARMAGIDAAAAERLRIERDLHDGAQPRLVALTMTLGLAKSKIDSDPERAKELVAEAHAEAKGIVNELRQLARGIHPAVLTDRGLDAAVSALAGRSPIPVEVDVRLGGRIEREAEAVAYFVVAECLTNIAKHSGATQAKVVIAPTEAGVEIVVTDNGHGGARIDRSGRHTGIAGLVDRVEAARGTLNLTSPAGGPTTIVVEVPCAS